MFSSYKTSKLSYYRERVATQSNGNVGQAYKNIGNEPWKSLELAKVFALNCSRYFSSRNRPNKKN